MHPTRFQLLRPTDLTTARRGIACLVGGPETLGNPQRPDSVTAHVAHFEEYAHDNRVDLTRQVIAFENGRVTAMTLWVPAAGRTAMLFIPNLSNYPAAAEPAIACLQQAMSDAQAHGIHLVQVMLEPADTPGIAAAEAAGLQRLATLIYQERTPPLLAPSVQLPPGYDLHPYERTTHPLFAQAITASYEATLDCPALSHLRHVDDVIAGHQAVGRFDPQLWSVILHEQQPVGCLLLANVPARRALEVVYLGLAPAARGKGLGRALLQRTLRIAAKRHFSLISLAVDAANTPALALYKRFGFGPVARRTALIRNLHPPTP